MPPPALERQFVWTVLPAGRVEPGSTGQPMALFSLLLTPRLISVPQTAGLTLADFGLQTWPQRLAVAQFHAFRGATQNVAARRVPMGTEDGRQISFTPEEQLSAWQAVFPARMPVRPHRSTSYRGRSVREYPASEAGAQIEDAYGSTVRALVDYDGDDPEQRSRRRSALREITDRWQAGLWPSEAKSTEAAAEPSPLRRAYEFYRRDTDLTPIAPTTARADDELDFHDVAARLADHPVLLRAVGLLFDFAVPAIELAGGSGEELRVVPRWPQPDPSAPPGWGNATQVDLSPRTAYSLAGSRFVPAPPAASPPGLLPLAGAGPAGSGTNPRFEVIPFDVDGAALRMVSVAESDHQQPASSADTTGALPTLRSMGFALVDTTRGRDHDARLLRAEQRATVTGLTGAPLTADNLVAGYRVDVYDATTRAWRSLCQRRVRYTAGTFGIGLLDEGYVRPESVVTGAGTDDALFIHQTVARWDGWSLVIPRPERVTDPIVLPPQPFTVDVALEPGSLPRLRFGRNYRLRVRLVDLAGGGLRRNDLGATEEQSRLFTHRRFEPLLAPELAPTTAHTDGAGHDLMVIRSDRGVPASDYAAAHGYRAVDLRHLFAPKSSLELAVQHSGTFDTALGPTVATSEVDRQFAVAGRADNDLGDVAGAELVPGSNGSGSYFVVPEAGVGLPWLADPEARSIAVRVRERPIDPFTGRPGATSGFEDPLTGRHLFQYPWKGQWPGRVPTAVRVVAAAGGCAATMELTGDRRTFSIALGPAEQVTVDIASCPAVDDIGLLGVAHWAGASPTDPAHPVTQHVYTGRNPLVTPPRTVTLVHAVQRPLADPGGELIAHRAMGDTHALLGTSRFAIDVRSTGRIDIRARWTDTDDIPPAKPTKREVVANVGSYDVAHAPLAHALDPIRQEFADTRRRRVTYTVTAVSRFRDHFARLTAGDPDACTVEGVLEVTDVPSTSRPPAPEVRYILPTFAWSSEAAGTVIRSSRRGGGLRVLLERPWFVSGADEALAVVAWPTPATAPPTSVHRHLSLAGRDPIWDTATPQTILNPDHFNAVGCPSAFLIESGTPVAAVEHRVQFDEGADCWYADIDLSPLAETSYLPFVRLALSRFQAHTADPHHRLSPLHLTEPLQLFPHRLLTVTRSQGRATVVVSGVGPGGARPNTLQAELQVFRGDPAVAADALVGPAGWEVLARRSGLLGANIQLDVPGAGAHALRISVTESETYSAAPASTASRVVYADIVTLDA